MDFFNGFCDCWCGFKRYKINVGAKDLKESYVKSHSLLWGRHSPHREIYKGGGTDIDSFTSMGSAFTPQINLLVKWDRYRLFIKLLS